MQHDPKKIALFVDFDNIYLGLRETSREAAEAFATRPHVWLKWIEHGMPIGDVDHVAPRESRALIRQCYLNPDSFGKYRGYFTRAGFSVVDCPSLTSRGKNSSDIVMVMDILDALRHETRFDRFVIMSADADFTPVLQRLRAHDRRTAVMVSGLAAPAYRASCDKLIEEDVFIEHALELVLTPEPSRAAAPVLPPAAPGVAAIRDPDLLAAIGQRVYEEASSSGTLPASELPRILREFKEFTPTSNWLGYYSLQGLTEALLVHRPELRITDDDPWRIAVRLADEPAAAPPAASASADAPPSPSAAEPQHPDFEALRDRVVGLVARLVAESAEPVVMGKAAHAAIQEVGPLLTETRWLGKGTFKNLLLSARELPFTVVASPLPGFVYDPERHQPPSERAAVDGLAELGTEMASLIRRMNQLTDAPKLTPRQYRVLWEVVAKELGRAPYNLMGTGKAVRDQCVERGEPIARQAITWVLRGLAYVGYRFFDPPHQPENLAAAYRGNLLNILRQAQVTLSEDELRMLDEWLLAGPSDAPAPAPPPPPSRRRAAPADPDAASEPDYAAWADALLAGESSGGRVPSASQPDAVAADPPGEDDGWPPKDVSPPRPPVEEEFEWPPKDALLFEPMDERPDRKKEPMEWPPSDTLFFEPTHAEETSAAPVDSPAGSADDSAPADVIDPPADAQPSDAGAVDADVKAEPDADAANTAADDSSQPVSEMHDDATPDEQPAQPAVEGEPQRDDVVSADWELANGAEPDQFPWEDSDADPSHVDASPTASETEPGSGVPVAEIAPAGESEDSDVVAADWQLAEDSPPPAAAEPDDAAQPVVEATQDAAAADDNPVIAEWQPAGDSPSADQPALSDAAPPDSAPAADAAYDAIVTPVWEPADASPTTSAGADASAPAADPTQESAPAAEPPADAAQPDASGVFTASWEPATDASAEPAAPGPADASGEQPVASSSEASVDAEAAERTADDVVTPQWEAVEPASSHGEPPAADPPTEPETQMDAFPPAAPPRDETPPREGQP